MNASRMVAPLASFSGRGSVVTLTFFAFNAATASSTFTGRNPRWSMACPAVGSVSPFCDQHPDAAVADAVDAIFELADRPAERIGIPLQDRARVWRAQMDVVDAELRRVLHDLDANAPRILHESQLEQPGDIARGGETFAPSASSPFIVASRSGTEKPM